MYFEYFKSSTENAWYWHLKAANHKVIAVSEGYKTEPGVTRSIRMMQTDGAVVNAEVVRRV